MDQILVRGKKAFRGSKAMFQNLCSFQRKMNFLMVNRVDSSFLGPTGELHAISEEAGVSIGVCKHLLKALLAYLRAGAKKGLTATLLQQQLTTIGVEGPKVRLVHCLAMKYPYLCM